MFINYSCSGFEKIANVIVCVHQAALESVKMLLKRGCKVDSVDSNHYAPLHLAARYNRLDCMRVLLNHGGSACDVVLPDGRAPVHLVSGLYQYCYYYCCCYTPHRTT